mmetsp:Transcript_2432/g.4768  ORF Transcript_2432/g.4768 Transcript_2432/m.4768 type:complete len:93 (+) Transcript_2432:54-332(+)
MLRRYFRPSVAAAARRSVASSASNPWKERSHAAEELWFTQHEGEIMQRMLAKIERQQALSKIPRMMTREVMTTNYADLEGMSLKGSPRLDLK